jgi:hypothetical protein
LNQVLYLDCIPELTQSSSSSSAATMAATTSQATPVSPTVGQWVHDFYDGAFFQPNLELSTTTMNENFAQGFTST